MPVNYSVHGIDVSRYQQKVNWQEVRSMNVDSIRISFAMIKATEGTDRTDPFFRRNMKETLAAGIRRGAYHFFIASRSGKIQAEHFTETVKLQAGDLPPVLDIEQVNGASVAEIRQRAKDWLTLVEAHYKVKPIIYTNIDFYNTFLAGSFDDYPLWVAHYLQRKAPRINRSWIFWQHSDGGHVNGIRAKTDFNVFNGDTSAFKKLLLK